MLRKLLLTLLILQVSFAAMSQLQVSKLFNDHAVLQREIEVPVWGWTSPGDRVTVTFNDKTYKAKANKTGKWIITLPSMSQGGPYEMTIKSGKESISFSDIMIGDVWLLSGQSNMEWVVKNSNNAEQEIASANDKMIRHYKVPLSTAAVPEEKLAGGDWKVTSPENVGDFSAVGYFFARELRKHVDVPIGLLNSSWGGSRIEPWMSAEALGKDPKEAEAYLMAIKKENEYKAQVIKEKLKDKFGPLPVEDAGFSNNIPVWADPKLNDSDWHTMELPSLWEAQGYEGLDGIIWFRKSFELSEKEASGDIILNLAMIDDADITWVNGNRVGETNGYSDLRKYIVPSEFLKAGKNEIAERVNDTGGGGGIYGPNDLLNVKTVSGIKSLAGEWKFKLGEVDINVNSSENQIAMLLYNKMIYPLLDFPIKGALWYQGESNAGGKDAYVYRELFPTMIKDWRERWGVGDFPFLFVQLANYMAPDAQPAESDWAMLRESQSETLSVPNTAQAVIIDIGEAEDIHPRNKQDVGYRLSLAARKLAYGENEIVYSGPVYKDHKIEGNKVIIEFDHVGSGLLVKDKYGYVNGFAIAGPDKKFVWAKAKQEGNKIIVWNENIENPVAVRYGWGNNPDDLNLYNNEGLPASPFRTDNW